MSDEGFFLGELSDPATGERTGERVHYAPGDLTTHGVIVGMTGSGKTGLGIIFVEEALRAGIPAIVIDPKGDMANLALTFPQLAAEDFEPWVDESEARVEGTTVAGLAAEKAELWREGLGSWGLDGDSIAELRDAARVSVYTPGSGAGLGVDVVGSLRRPEADWETSEEDLRAEIQAFVSGLLGLIGVDADPISSKQHILLANLVERAWREGSDLDMATLLAQVQAPPMRKLGVFEVDAFIPEADRTELALQINALLASPAFAAWMTGDPIDIGAWLWDSDGRPRCSVVSIAHLSDAERQFVVTLVLARVVTWMRRQSGSGDLRALVYMDEMAGFAPPTAEPPSKQPILTLLKQARAYGVGMLVATQNPMDLDYKAMSNAGTWCVGRLQTDRDKARIVEGLRSVAGDRDVAALDAAISGLHQRQFLLQQAGPDEPLVFTTRWAMSYLAGPLTREQIARLPGSPPAASSPAASPAEPEPQATAPPAAAAAREDETPVMPSVAGGVTVRHVAPAAPWLAAIGGSPDGTRYRAGLAFRVHLRYDDTTAGVDHQEEWESVITPLADPFEPGAAVGVDHDDRDLLSTAPPGIVYEIPGLDLTQRTWFTAAKRAVADHLYRNRSVSVHRNPHLSLYSRVGEDEAAFLARCDSAAQERADEEVAKLRDRYEEKLRRAQRKVDDARRRADELAVDVQGARSTEMLDQAGAVLGVLLGRGSTRSLSRTARSRATVRSKEQRMVSAEERAEDEASRLSALEEEMAADLEAIDERWETRAAEIEAFEVPLDKTDIDVEDPVLIWFPTAPAAG